jgi:alpha-galactosidase
MKHVADEIHDLGLLFGMYSSAGEMTCARYGIALILSSHMIGSDVDDVL